MQYDPLISIVIPVYNEGDNIKPLVRAIKERVNYAFKILAVYDFDEDNRSCL